MEECSQNTFENWIEGKLKWDMIVPEAQLIPQGALGLG